VKLGLFLKRKNKYKLPGKAEELKSKANASFDQQNYVEAIVYYNKAINLVPNSPILYGNRAAALMKRNWYGDTYCAMLDCYKALSFDIMHLKSHFRLAKCLFDLKWYREADEVIKIFVKRFPDYAETLACENLVKDIKGAIDNSTANNNQSGSRALRNRKKTSNNTLTNFLKQNPNNHTNGEESEELESEDDTSSNEEDYEEKEDSTNEDDEIDLDQIDLSNYLNDDDEKMIEDDDDNKTGDRDSDSIYKLKRSTRKKRCDTNNNTAHRSNLNNDNNNCKKILNKKKKLKALIKRYNEVKSESVDFKSRYCGHCNVDTDIKEAAFLGE
jgi:tetratricopeptide (TPR) repeat protein